MRLLVRLVSKFLSFLPIWRWKEQMYFFSLMTEILILGFAKELLLLGVCIIFTMFTHLISDILIVHSFLLFFLPEDYMPVVLYFVGILFYYFILILDIVVGEREGGNRVHRTMYHLCADCLLCFDIQILLFNILTFLLIGLLIITAGKLESPSNNDWNFFLQYFYFSELCLVGE